MDKIDKQILNLLQRDCSISLHQIADKLHLTTTPCWNRIKRLENEGMIKQRVALLDAEKIGLELIAFVQIKTQQHSESWFENFVLQVKSFTQVMEFYRMAGEYDYMLKVLVKDMRSYDLFYKTLVNNVSGLTDVNSSFAMEQLKYTTELPL
jgi:Lrp/AsnC family transcriptional regulator